MNNNTGLKEVSDGIFLTDDGLISARTNEERVLGYLYKNFSKQAVSKMKKMAIKLHEMLCHGNHTDYCGWYYEIRDGVHDWNRWEHQHYLIYAHNCYVSKITVEMVKAVERATHDIYSN